MDFSRFSEIWNGLSKKTKGLFIVAVIVMSTFASIGIVYAVGGVSCGSGSFTNVLKLNCYTAYFYG